MAHLVPVLHILLLWPMPTPKFQNAEAHGNQKGAPQAQTQSPAEALLVTYHQREVLQNISCDHHSSSRRGGGGRRSCRRRRRGRGRGCGRRCPLGTWNDCTSPRYQLASSFSRTPSFQEHARGFRPMLLCGFFVPCAMGRRCPDLVGGCHEKMIRLSGLFSSEYFKTTVGSVPLFPKQALNQQLRS